MKFDLETVLKLGAIMVAILTQYFFLDGRISRLEQVQELRFTRDVTELKGALNNLSSAIKDQNDRLTSYESTQRAMYSDLQRLRRN